MKRKASDAKKNISIIDATDTNYEHKLGIGILIIINILNNDNVYLLETLPMTMMTRTTMNILPIDLISR